MKRVSLGLLLGLALGVGCTNYLENHCANLAGDQTCVDRGMGSFCSSCVAAADGCTDVMPADDCYFAGVGWASGTSGMHDTADMNTDGEMTADETSPEPQGCLDDEECGGNAPFCGTAGVCAGCDETSDPDGACEDLDPAAPLCVGGVCVQCTEVMPTACAGDTPVCEDASNTCVACTEHDQCGEAACNFYTGACLSAEAVVHVGTGQEFTNLTDAVESFGVGEEGTIIVHAGDYMDSVTVGDGRVLAFLAFEDDRPVWYDSNLGWSPQLSVDKGTALLDNIRLSGTFLQPALVVSTGQAWLDHCRIVNNLGGGILANSGAELTLRNCFVGGNGDGANALEVVNASATVLYSTLAVGLLDAIALSCSSGADVTVRNSIIVASSNSIIGTSVDIACSQANISFTATESFASGVESLMVEEISWDWFVAYWNGDFHIQNDGLTVFADIAQWQTGDPRTDIDGNPRPNIDGASDYAGADRP